MITLPTSVPQSSQWQLLDWTEATLTSDPAAGGIATATGDQLDSDVMWLIAHAVTSCTSSTTTSLRMYASNIGPRFLLDGSNTSGNFDVGDWSPGLLLRPGRQLIAQWSGASAGAVGTLNIQAQVYQRVVS